MRKLACKQCRTLCAFSWSTLHILAVFAILAFYMAYNLHLFLFQRLHDTYFLLAVPILIAVYYCREGLRGGLEIKLVTLLGLWMLITRLLCGDLFLEKDLGLVLDVFLACAILGVGISLSSSKRTIFMDAFSIVFCLFYTMLAAICIYTAVFQREIYNPYSEWYLATIEGGRLYALSSNPNGCCVWFFISFFLAVYLFFRWEKWYLRLPLCFSALLNFTALGLTFSRNMKLGFCLCFSMLLVLLVLERMSSKKFWHKVVVIVLILCIFAPITYKSFDMATNGINKLTAIVSQEREANQEVISAESISENPSMQIYTREDSLFYDTGRIPIYKSAFWILKEEPLRLLKGSLSEDIHTIIKKYIVKFEYGHFHNSFLEILVLTGIPGFILAMAFFMLVVWHCIRLFFSKSSSTAEKVLTIIITGLFSYNMLESSLFCSLDVRSISFFLISGFVIAFSKELHSADAQENLNEINLYK